MATLISIVIPLLNEERNVPLVHRAIAEVFDGLSGRYDFELIFVNDGSTDNTWQSIELITASDSRVRGLSFSRNFGNQFGFEAGMKVARGALILMMDGDLQHPPALIPTILSKHEEGFEVVTTTRTAYAEESFFKKTTSTLFYRLFNLIADHPIDPSASDFMLMSRRVADMLNSIPETERLYRGLVRWVGVPRTSVPFVAPGRVEGQSGYSFKKLLALMWTAIISYSTIPMKAIILFGLGLMCIAGLLLLVMGYVRFILDSEYFTEMAFLVVGIIGINGLTLAIIGLVAMYLLRIYKEARGYPNYIIDQTVNW